MRVLKIATWTIGALLGLLVAGAAILVLIFDPNDYKEYAQTWVEERTGRSLTIEGDIELSLFPWLAVETGRFELGNADGFGPQPFISAQRASARVRLIPLIFDQEFEIGTISIDGLELDLAVNEDGTTNWSDLTPAATIENAPDVPPETPGARTPGALESLDIEGVRLRGSRVVWRENGGPRFIVSELALSTGAIAPGTPIDLALQTQLLDVATQRNASIALTTTAAADASGAVSAAASTIEFSIAAAGGSIDAQGTAEIDTLEFVPGARLRATGVRLTNDVASPLAAGSRLASELAWSALDVDLKGMNFTVDDLEAVANDVRARIQLIGEDLLGESAVLRGSIVIDDASAAAALGLAGLTLPDDIDPDELGNFAASTAFLLALETQNIELSNLDFSILGIDLRAQQATLRGDNINAQLDITAFRPNQNLRRLIARYLPEELDVDSIGSVAFAARVAGTFDNLNLTGMRLNALGAEVTGQVRLQQSGAGMNVSGDISSNQFATNEIYAVLGAFVPESISNETAGMVAIAGQFTWNAAARAADVRGLRVEAFGMRGTGEIRTSGAGDSLDVSGSIQLEEINPRELLGRFSLAVPQTSDESALRRAIVSTRFEASPSAATFEDLVVVVDDSTIRGSFVVDDFENPMYRFTLVADRFDADRYLPPQAPPGADEDVQTSERRAGDIKLSNDALNAVNIDANIRVGQLHLAGMDFSNVATSMVVGSGRMLLDSAHADLYGGSFDGRFHVDASTDLPTMLLQGTTQGLALQPLLTALAGSASFSGTGSFDIDLRGSGPTITDNLQSAAGSLQFALLNGAIEGFNVDKSLCRAFNTVRGNPAPRDVPARSAYEFIRGTASVTNGIATSNDLVARIGSTDIRGNGTLALADQIADYHFEARLARNVTIPGCEEMERIVGYDFPVEVEGPVTSPDIAPDYGEVIRRVIENRIRENVRDRILDRILQ